MTDKIPSFKDQIDEIHVPTEKLDDIILKTIQEEHPPKRKKSWRNKFVYSASAAVVAFGLLIGSATVSPAMADIVSKIPLIGSIFSESDNVRLAQVSNLGLTQVVGLSQTVEGDTITIDEVFYDGIRLTVSYSLESQEPLWGHYFKSAGPDFTINGKSISYGGSLEETEVTPTYRTGIADIGAFDDLPKELDFGLTFEGKDNKIWQFKFPVKARTDVEIIELNHTQTVGGVELSVPDFKMSPGGLHFNFQAIAKENNNFTATIDFKIVDDSGQEITGHSGVSQSEIVKGTEYSSGNRLFDPIADDVKELTVTPYFQLPTGGDGVEVDEEGNETKLEFKPYIGGEIEFKSFTIKVPKNN